MTWPTSLVVEHTDRGPVVRRPSPQEAARARRLVRAELRAEAGLAPVVCVCLDLERSVGCGCDARAELPGILAWAVRGCLEWQASGLAPPKAVSAATGAYRESENMVGRFLADVCRKVEGKSVGATELYRLFVAWCDDEGERAPTQKRFGDELTRRGFESFRGSDGGRPRRWRGLVIMIGHDSTGKTASSKSSRGDTRNTVSDHDRDPTDDAGEAA